LPEENIHKLVLLLRRLGRAHVKRGTSKREGKEREEKRSGGYLSHRSAEDKKGNEPEAPCKLTCHICGKKCCGPERQGSQSRTSVSASAVKQREPPNPRVEKERDKTGRERDRICLPTTYAETDVEETEAFLSQKLLWKNCSPHVVREKIRKRGGVNTHHPTRLIEGKKGKFEGGGKLGGAQPYQGEGT